MRPCTARSLDPALPPHAASGGTGGLSGLAFAEGVELAIWVDYTNVQTAGDGNRSGAGRDEKGEAIGRNLSGGLPLARDYRKMKVRYSPCFATLNTTETGAQFDADL